MDDEWTIPGLDGRRAFLKRGGAAMAAATAYGLYPEMGLAADVPRQFDGSKFQLKAAESNPKRGGVLRTGFLSRQPHFDILQSGTFSNVGIDPDNYFGLYDVDRFDTE